jgi:hypothetical protein
LVNCGSKDNPKYWRISANQRNVDRKIFVVAKKLLRIIQGINQPEVFPGAALVKREFPQIPLREWAIPVKGRQDRAG